MIVQMDKTSTLSSWELAQRFYEKNIELENKRRRSAQARVPSDPNAWQQIRENYEKIILEDHAFSEQHNIEYALWQLHYRRIEEFRAHFSTALASTGSSTSQGVKGPPRPDRISKIRLQFKTFLSEATGFYHDLILKIRAKYGLPLGYISEDSDNRIVMDKEGKRSIEMKKGMISCHRCLIYLGDLARYKGLYGEGDSKSRDYAAALSYYLQAASLWPSSGNPHHQLAILATYSGDELVAVYRYFRSLAAESPFSTARDNLIVAFEKNRQTYSQLHGDTKTSTISESPIQLTSKGRAKEDTKLQPKDAYIGTRPDAERTSRVHDPFKAFCVHFVRLNGIIFTRTSLENFAEVLSLVSSSLNELLSSETEEELNFGTNAVEDGLVIVRLISILIFTVHNVMKDGEGQTYADIVQHTVLRQNALTAVFELVGNILKRCAQLHDPCSSYLLPGILVFVEWLACSPAVAVGCDIDDKQAVVQSVFWNHCVSFLNKLLSSGLAVMNDEDEACFFNMGRYEEGETENWPALWEDVELRGFLPLQRAQTILNFSRKYSAGGDANKEKISRVKRILAAGKALANVVNVDQKTLIFDLKAKKFVLGVKLQASDDFTFSPFLGNSKLNNANQLLPIETTNNAILVEPKAQPYVEGEEEDEVIVFKPSVMEKQSVLTVSKWIPYEDLEPVKKAFVGTSLFRGGSISVDHSDILRKTAFDAASQPPLSVSNHVSQHLQTIQSHSSMRPDQQASLTNDLNGLSILGNGHIMKPGMHEVIPVSHHASLSLPLQQSVNANASGISYSQAKASKMAVQSNIEYVAPSGVASGSFSVNASPPLPTSLRKIPVNRPVRHLGPPPGFSSVHLKPANEPISGSDCVRHNLPVDDYCWLDGYKLPLSMGGSGLNPNINHPTQSDLHYINNNNGSVGTVSFPFLGKQNPLKQFPVEKLKGYEDNHTIEHVNLHREQPQPLVKGIQQSMWGTHHPV